MDNDIRSLYLVHGMSNTQDGVTTTSTPVGQSLGYSLLGQNLRAEQPGSEHQRSLPSMQDGRPCRSPANVGPDASSASAVSAPWCETAAGWRRPPPDPVIRLLVPRPVEAFEVDVPGRGGSLPPELDGQIEGGTFAAPAPFARAGPSGPRAWKRSDNAWNHRPRPRGPLAAGLLRLPRHHRGHPHYPGDSAGADRSALPARPTGCFGRTSRPGSARPSAPSYSNPGPWMAFGRAARRNGSRGAAGPSATPAGLRRCSTSVGVSRSRR